MPFPGFVASFDVFVPAPVSRSRKQICILRARVMRPSILLPGYPGKAQFNFDARFN